MKHTITILTIITLLILTACERQETTTPTGAVVQEIEQETEQQPKQETIIEEKTIADQEKRQTPAQLPPAPVENKVIIEKSRKLSPELRDLLQKADNEVKSFSYLYSETGNLGFDTHYLKGTKIKIALFEKNDYNVEDYFNIVYLDTAEKTAYGTCENRKRCLTKIADNTKRVYQLYYEDFRTKTPYEWIKEVEYAEITGYEMINNKAVTKIEYEQNEEKTEMWVDNRYGLPHKIRITYDGEEKVYSFKNLLVNTVKDGDIVSPLIK
ncbi:DUF2092 domain-containing protein [Candidatus Woesearchaeota archaeon]|nr:DUF2092 domain-containing protein [Candidatus Woesearchaeota archaeon]